MRKSARYRLDLLGPFGLIAPDGGRIEVASKKARALIALLAMSRGGARSRVWLQDMLWGSRAPDQAQASLRRELSNLRKLAPPHGAILFNADHNRVVLATDLLAIDALVEAPNGNAAVDAPGEFLEGLDIAGEDGFEDWLRDQRRSFADRLESAARRDNTATSLPAGIVDLSQPAPGFGGRPALAVLPLENLTGDLANDYLAEGISEDLIDRLSRLRWLPVIARGSSFSFGDDGGSRRRAGTALGARYILDGCLRRFEGEYGLSAHITDAETGYVVMSHQARAPLPVSPDLLAQLATDVVAALGVRVDRAEQTRALRKPPSNLDVNDLIWRGRWHLHRFTREDALAAQGLFAQALALDPSSPEALINATHALAWSIWAERKPDAEIDRLRVLAQRAIVADCEDGRGYMFAGMAELWARHHARARSLFEQAIALNPSLSLAHAQLGAAHYLAGDAERALGPLRTALRLSPSDQFAFYILGDLAMSHCMLGDWRAAVEHADQSLVRRRAYWYAHVIKIVALVHDGNPAAAGRAFGELHAAKPGFRLDYIDWLPFAGSQWPAAIREALDLASAAFTQSPADPGHDPAMSDSPALLV